MLLQTSSTSRRLRVRFSFLLLNLCWDVILTNMTGKGLGASNAPAAKEGHAPGEAPVASDSGNSNVGVDPSANKPGEKGIGGPNYGTH